MFPQQAVALICVSTVFPALAIVAVGLRVYARFLAGIRLNWSDYMIFFTLVSHVTGGPTEETDKTSVECRLGSNSMHNRSCGLWNRSSTFRAS